MRPVFAAALLVAACATAPAAGQTPDWIAGHWRSCENGRQVTETWTGAGSGVLVGAGLTRGARGVDFEFLRIAPHEGGVAYFASPRGAPPTTFRLASQTENRVVFENLAHDFPQRIIYERNGDGLTARIENADSTRGMTWRFRKADIETVCP